jgi:uncharacterized protein YcfJ
MRKTGFAALIMAASALGACSSTTDPALRGGLTGAAVGAAAGAVAGEVIGGVSTEEGVAAGAVAGGVIGAVASGQRRYAWDYDGRCYYVDGNGNRNYVDPDRCR